jgi:hypothetical protein
MGTSKSYGGPSDISRLLPSWALPGAGPAPAEAATSGTQSPPSDAGQGSASPIGISAAGSLPPRVQPPVPVNSPWKGAKRSLGLAVRGGGGGSRDYRRAAKDYVRAHGGAPKAARSAAAARGATARFAGFLASFPSLGAEAAVKTLGLAAFTGRSVDDLLATITNALAPDGATLEEAAARRAIAETLAELYDRWGVDEGGLDRLQSMSADDIRAAVTESVSACIFFRWVLELGLAIERKAISVREAAAMEGEMRQYIRDTLKLDLAKIDVLVVDWAGEEGRRLIDNIFDEAYGLIETSI